MASIYSKIQAVSMMPWLKNYASGMKHALHMFEVTDQCLLLALWLNCLVLIIYGRNLNVSFSNSLYRVVVWALVITLLSNEYCKTSLMRSQHWFRQWLEDICQGQGSSHATHPLMLLIICTKYWKNPSWTVDATGRTRKVNGQTDRRTDRQTRWIQYTPPNFVAGV